MEKNRQNAAALLTDCSEQMGVPMAEEQTRQFMAYLVLILEWNEKNRASGNPADASGFSAKAHRVSGGS